MGCLRHGEPDWKTRHLTLPSLLHLVVCDVWLRMSIIRFIPVSNWHSQITAVAQPSCSNRSTALRSLILVRQNLLNQNSVFVAGTVVLLQPCLCQKQPWTNKAKRFLGNTRSGLPGKSLRCRRNRCPARWRARRTTISGLVFWERTLDMIALRVFVSTWSAICLYRALARSLRSPEAARATKVTRFPAFTVGPTRSRRCRMLCCLARRWRRRARPGRLRCFRWPCVFVRLMKLLRELVDDGYP